MKRFSEDRFVLQSNLTQREIVDTIERNTLKTRSLVMKLTSKDFIGKVGNDSFKLIPSSFPIPYGAVCILRGDVSDGSSIVLTSTLHKAFRIIFLVWFIGMTMTLLIFWMIESGGITDLFSILIGMPIVGLIFRLYLHGMYVLARDHGLKKMKDVLQIDERGAPHSH